MSWLASQPKLNARSKSGYILFSAEIRKRIMQENPEAGFGEVSKIVGIEVWPFSSGISLVVCVRFKYYVADISSFIKIILVEKINRRAEETV